jgi:multidrug resistance efflux pump
MSVVITGLFPGKGRIESITGGISAANAASSTQGLPNVDPIFTWVRLAQRIPVRVRIEQIPPKVPLVAGMTCSVSVVGGEEMPVARRGRGLFYRLENLL